jgi:succinoglycan biosynthesis transport protein ExoP
MQMELKEYWILFWKWKWLVVVGILLAGGTAFVASRSQTPVYQATTRLLVSPGGTPQSSESYASLVASERLAQTYAQLLMGEVLATETLQRLGLIVPEAAGDPDQSGGFSLPSPLATLNPWLDWLASSVGLSLPEGPAAQARMPITSILAEPVQDTQLLRLRVEGTDPGLVTKAANTLVEVFIEWQKEVQRSRYAESKANLTAGMERVQADIDETEVAIQALEMQGSGADRNELVRLQDQLSQYRNSLTALLNSYANIELAEANSGATVTVVSPAVVPEAPFRPRVMMNTLLAAVVGGMLAVGIAFLVEYLDDTVKTPDDLRAADLNLLAAVQRVGRDRKNGRKNEGEEGLYTRSQPRSIVSESYRTLRTNLQFSSLDTALKSLVITSALASEGKTTTAANLAVVIAQDGKRVVLVDADLRRPNVHRIFDLPNRTGLTTALVDDPAAISGLLRNTGIENLQVLTAGPVPPNPQEMLGSARMAELLERLLGQADIVLLDTPPALAVADANVLATRTDGALLVVNTGETRRAALQQAVEGLTKVGANIVGGVLNMVPTRKGDGYYFQHHYYYVEYRQEEERPGIRGRARRSRRMEPGSRSREGRIEPV